MSACCTVQFCLNFSSMLAQKLRSSTETSQLNETQSLQAVKSMLQVSLQEIAWSLRWGKRMLAGHKH